LRFYIGITLAATFYSSGMNAVELSTYILPSGGGQNVFFGIQDGRKNASYLVLCLQQVLDLLNINELSEGRFDHYIIF
jgi:hypothetical protein